MIAHTIKGVDDCKQTVVGGSSSLTITNDTASLTSIVGESSYLNTYILAVAGETVTMKCTAKVVSGTVGTKPCMAIDYPAAASLKNKIEFDSTDWKDYSVSFTVPITSSGSNYLKLLWGMYTSLAGSVKIRNVSIHKKGGTQPVANLFANALIQLSAGVPTVNDNFSNVGIKALSYDVASKELRITIDPVYLASAQLAPVIQVNMTAEFYPELAPKWKAYDRATGQFIVQFIDMSLAVPITVDLATYPNTFYLAVTAIS